MGYIDALKGETAEKDRAAGYVNVGGRQQVAVRGIDNRDVSFKTVQAGSGTVKTVRTDTGADYKPDIEGSGMGFSIGNVFKKAVSVVTATAAGAVGGGQIGALGGAVKGVIGNTKTSKAAPITAGYAGDAFVTGAAANIGAGIVAGGYHALAGAGAVAPGTATTGVLNFLKKGGLVGVAKAIPWADLLGKGKEQAAGVDVSKVAELVPDDWPSYLPDLSKLLPDPAPPSVLVPALTGAPAPIVITTGEGAGGTSGMPPWWMLALIVAGLGWMFTRDKRK